MGAIKTDKDTYKQLGICVVCKKRKAEPNSSSCLECLEKDRKRKAEYRMHGHYNNEKSNQLHRKLYASRKEQGICTRCGERKATNGTVCLDCYVKRRKQNYGISRSERPSYGECYICGRVVLKGKRVCESCYHRLLINTGKRMMK